MTPYVVQSCCQNIFENLFCRKYVGYSIGGTSNTVNVGHVRNFVNVIVYNCIHVMTIAIDKMMIVLTDWIDGNDFAIGVLV